MSTQQDKFNDQKTEVISDFKVIENKISEVISNPNTSINILMDSSRPEIIIKNNNLRELIINRKLNCSKLKAITEITRENINYCKDLMLIVDELRHLNGIKGTFYLSDMEYISHAYLQKKEKPVEQIIYSNVKESVEHQQYIFQTLWNKAIPAGQKLREIQEGIIPASIEIVNEPFQMQQQSLKMAKSANEEILILFSSSAAFHRTEKVEGISQLVQIVAERKIKVRILTPMDNDIRNFYNDLKKQSYDIDIKHMEGSSITFVIVDSKFYLAAELGDDTKDNIQESAGKGTYSNSQSTVLFYVSIFESFWQQAILFEKTQKELDKTKDEMAEMRDYLNLVLKEINHMKR